MADAPDDHADRLNGLIDAHRVITSDSDLDAMLSSIVRAACELIGTGYAVLGVLDGEGLLERSVRFGKLTGPAATREVLEVPIGVGSTTFGNLFLAEPHAGSFAADDEKFAGALAVIAGTAVQGARLVADARRSNEWLTAAGDIARALLLEGGKQALPLIVQRAVDVGDAQYGTLIIPTPDGRLQARYTAGTGADQFQGLVFDPAESEIGRAVFAGEVMVVADVTDTARAGFVNEWNFGPAMLIPLDDPLGVRGAVLLIRTRNRPPFAAREVEMAGAFAAQVALALQFDDARMQREQLRALEVRHRIAQDLHDNVIQRLFATGVGLQSVQNAADAQSGPTVAERLARHIRDLDETIEEIRNRVFGLRDELEPAGDTEFPHIRP